VRRLTLAFVSSLFLVAALASTALAHHVSSIGCDGNDIEVVANIGGGHTIVVTIDGNEVLNDAIDGAVTDHTWTFAYEGGPAAVDVKIYDLEDDLESSMSDEVNCYEPQGEPSIDLDKFVWDEGGLVDQVTEGDPVTYTYEVTNDGEVNLDIVLLEDLIVSSPDTDPGDVACDDFERQLDDPGNDDAIFEPGETWVLTCTVDGLPVGVTENEACVYANVADEIKPDTVQDPHESDVSSCAEYEITVIEGGTQGGTGTPAASLPNSALSSQSPGTPIATLGFGLLLLSSLGALAAVNVRSTRR